MPRDQPHVPHLNPINRRAAEDGAPSGVRPARAHNQLAYEHDTRAQVSNRPTNHAPEYLPPRTRSNSDVRSPGVEKSGHGSTSLRPIPLATHLSSHGSTVEAHGREDLPNNVIHIPRSIADSNEGSPHSIVHPEKAGEYSSNRTLGYWRRSPAERSASGYQEPNYTQHSSWNRSVHSHDALFLFNSLTSTSGSRRHQNQPAVMGEGAILLPRLSHFNNHRSIPHSAVNHTTLKPEGLLGELWNGHDNPNPSAEFYHSQRPPATIQTLTGLSVGRTNALEYARLPDPRSPCNGGMGDMGHLTESPQNSRSDRLPSQPTRVQLSRNGGEAEQTASPGEAAAAQKRTRKRNPGDFRAYTVQLRIIPTVTFGPTRLILVPQTPYKCPTAQESWTNEGPIEFGGIKLTDAANLDYLGLHGRDDKVLDYEGVRGTILCRLIFSRSQIGYQKILTTNNKAARDPITRKKLAFEISKFVWRHVEIIKDQPCCADITFENMVLVKLVHVARASWQPELWYEAPVTTPGST